MIKITDSMVFLKPFFNKIVSNIPKMCFETYLNHQINKKKNVARKRRKKTLGRSQFSKKREGGPTRYNHDPRFNGFFYPFLIAGLLGKFKSLIVVVALYQY